MTKRAKRALRINPREERNLNSSITRRTGKREGQVNNIIKFPNLPKQKRVEIIPRSLNQESLVAALEDPTNHVVFATGPAGSGKTLLCTLFAIKQLKDGNIRRIVITRPNVAVDDNGIGHLPGDLLTKMAPWIRPFIDIFMDFYPKKEIEYMMQEEIIEVMPIAFCRGRTLKDAVVVVDEAQGTTPNSLLSLLTRIGNNCKILVTGDIDQSDLGSENGLADFLRRSRTHHCDGVHIVQFEDKDVIRHPVIPKILDLYSK